MATPGTVVTRGYGFGPAGAIILLPTRGYGISAPTPPLVTTRGLDLSNDWRIIDDPVSIGYAAKTTESTWNPPVTVDYCQRNAVTKADLKQHPALLEQDATVFHAWKAKLSGIVPKIGDKLSHDGAVWVVKEVGHCDRDKNGVQRYRCIVIRSRGSQAL